MHQLLSSVTLRSTNVLGRDKNIKYGKLRRVLSDEQVWKITQNILLLLDFTFVLMKRIHFNFILNSN